MSDESVATVDSPTVERGELFELLREALVEHLRGFDGFERLDAVRVEYQGAGGRAEKDYWVRWVSEQGSSWHCASASALLVRHSTFTAPQGVDERRGGWVPCSHPEPVARSVEVVLDELLELAWRRAGVGRWWDGTGGLGSLEIDVASGDVELLHTAFVQTEVLTSLRWAVCLPSGLRKEIFCADAGLDVVAPPGSRPDSLARVERLLSAHDEAESDPAELLADLLHLINARGLLFEEVLQRARGYSRADTQGEGSDGRPI